MEGKEYLFIYKLKEGKKKKKKKKDFRKFQEKNSCF